MSGIKIGGIQKMTLIDYPGKIAAAVFLVGCNFRCAFCHNPDLVEQGKNQEYISEKDFFDFLTKRKDLLEGVCISGGEPLCQNESSLLNFLEKIKALGFFIKLDTNGYNFPLLKKLLAQKGLIDYVAMDIKGADKYGEITRINGDFTNIAKSIKLIMASGLDYEFRTTVLPKFHDLIEFEKLVKSISGAKKFYIQNFRNSKTLDPSFSREPSFRISDLEKMKVLAMKYVKNCELRS